MTKRRDFLKAAAGTGVLGVTKRESSVSTNPGIAAAREMVRQGELGAIHFCRIAHLGLRETASYVLDRAECVFEIEPEAEGAALLGSRGTLVVRGAEWRVFAQES